MKTLYQSICLMLIITTFNLPAYSQHATDRKNNPEQPLLFTPKSHDPNFLKSAQFPEKSFYQRKSEWKHIIDTTWGPGAPLEEKLRIFNAYAKAVHDRFDGIQSLKLNWDSLYNHYLNQINDSTSKGAFSAIMSHFAYEFKDLHTYACDTTVINTTLNPGIPVLFIGSYISVEHFGAVTTLLPDSTTLVLRVAPNHPLNLEPGDIILGYEGIPWKVLVGELRTSGMPFLASTGGCITVDTYQNFSGAGLNWHLFSTIDILKLSTGDTLHLSLESMADFSISYMVNNEQLPIANIPFPKPLLLPMISDTLVTYGILENTNIGYIYLSGHFPKETADVQFYKAIDSLKNTDALIIDMRFNYGGNGLLNQGLDILFNESHKTIMEAQRCNINTFEICPINNSNVFDINVRFCDYFDQPIAVLLGPTCMSMGDLTAHRLRYHPMVRFFGTSSSGSLGYSESINITDWDLFFSTRDQYLANHPENFLNRKEFPIDFPVWFNKDDVAKGIDPIVEKAREWISNLSYGHSLVLNQSSFSTEDTLIATATIENPEAHELLVTLIIESLDSAFVDSTQMQPLNFEKTKEWQVSYDVDNLPENYYWLSVKVEDQTKGTFFTNKHMTRFSTVPLIIDSLEVKKMADYSYSIRPYIKNAGDSVTIQQTISVTLTTNPWVKSITPKMTNSTSLKPGQVQKLAAFKLACDTATFQNHFDLRFSIASQGWTFWVIDTTITVIPTSAETDEFLPLANNLDQNFPNPFNVQTTIKWKLAKGNRVSLTVYNILGSKVATLVDEYKSPGEYETILNASTLPKGIYFYQLKAGKFIQTRKMIVER